LVVCQECNNRNGDTIAEVYPAPQVIDPRIAYIMNTMLRSVVVDGSGNRVERDIGRGDLMGKTGTTNGPQELWFSGFNRDIATTVFVGFDHPQPLGEREQGATVAVPIWIDYMSKALQGRPEHSMERPDGIVDRLIDMTSGKPALPGDSEVDFEFFREELAPKPLDLPLPEIEIENEEEKISTEIIF
ncbi:MAG: peptidase, partial [Gammaproteobacteria bacterium]|nr:peptidase [Gammaproteobacteria bacterium]